MMVDASVARSVLISEADAAPKLREFKVFSAAQRERVGVVISGMLSQWQAEWDWRGKITDLGSLEVRVRDAADSTYAAAWNQQWMVFGPAGHGAGFLKMRWRAGDVDEALEFPAKHFAVCLWGAADEYHLPEFMPVMASLAAETARSMWQDLWRRWIVACAPDGTVAAPPGVNERTVNRKHPGEFSGVLLVEFFAAGLQWIVALEPADVDSILAKFGAAKPGAVQQPLKQVGRVRVDTALRQHTLVLDAYLHPRSITLGGLQNLRVGDVIPLEHLLDQPSQLFSENREKVAQAWMTQTNGFKSLELAGTPQ